MGKKGKMICDLCGHEIIAHVAQSNIELFKIDSFGKLLGKVPGQNYDVGDNKNEDISFHCSNPKCGQLIGDEHDLKFYVGNSDPDEFRLFKQLDILQDVIGELCRMKLYSDSLNTSVVIRNTLKDLPKKLPIIIDMKRKMVEGDFIEKIDLKSIFKDLDNGSS